MKWTVFLAAMALADGVVISSAAAQCGYYSRVPGRAFYTGRFRSYYGASFGYGPRVYYGPFRSYRRFDFDDDDGFRFRRRDRSYRGFDFDDDDGFRRRRRDRSYRGFDFDDDDGFRLRRRDHRDDDDD